MCGAEASLSQAIDRFVEPVDTGPLMQHRGLSDDQLVGQFGGQDRPQRPGARHQGHLPGPAVEQAAHISAPARKIGPPHLKHTYWSPGVPGVSARSGVPGLSGGPGVREGGDSTADGGTIPNPAQT